MVFPGEVICSVDLASGSIVEDLKLALDLAAAGHPPLFCPSARIGIEFATTIQGADIQRTRYEGGHVGTILARGPRLLFMAVACTHARHSSFTSFPSNLDANPDGFDLERSASKRFSHGFALTAQLVFPDLVFAAFVSWLKYGRRVLSDRAILSMPLYPLEDSSLSSD